MDPAVREQIIGVLRIVIPLVLGIGVARGWFSADAVGQITSVTIDFAVAAIALGSIIWSFMSNRESSQINRVAQMASVQKVVTTKEMADRLQYSPKISSKVSHK